MKNLIDIISVIGFIIVIFLLTAYYGFDFVLDRVFTYALSCALLNSVILFMSGIKIKRKSLKGRKEPIYKIISLSDSRYVIYKYIKGYDFISHSAATFVIPFISLFKVESYVLENKKVEFFMEDVFTIPDLGEFYEESLAAKERIKQRKVNPLEQLNKEYNENYI